MRSKALIFIDPGYLAGIGHYENYGHALRQAAEARDLSFSHYVNRAVPQSYAEALHLQRWFPCPATISDAALADDVRRQYFIDSFAARLLAILRRTIRETPSDTQIRLFMYTGNLVLLPVIGEVMNSEEFCDRDICFIFNLFYVSNEFALKIGGFGYAAELRQIVKDLERADPAHRVCLFADSQRIINVYRRYFQRSINLLPIPLGIDSGKLVSRDTHFGAVRIGYLGYTQAKQGYHFIRLLYQDLLNKPDWMHVSLKVRHNVFNIDTLMLGDLRKLVGSTQRIENFVNFQSPEEYDAFFEDCDIIAIPHERTAYPLQTSGMLIDALCRGKPVIVPENTWLADQLRNYGAGVTFSGLGYESFRDAVAEAVESLDELKGYSEKNQAEFAAFHSPGNLLQILFSDLDDDVLQIIDPMDNFSGDCVQLLSLDVLEHDPDITELVYAEKIARSKNLGWHYMLDLTWVARQLKDLPPGSVVLDAGAGDGLLQYVLLRMGLRVISVDFIVRRGPRDVNWIAISAGETYDNEYVDHLKKNYVVANEGADDELVLQSVGDFSSLLQEKSTNLFFYRSDVSDMALLPDGLVDAVVSV